MTSAAAGGIGKGIANGTGKSTPAVYSAGLLKQTLVLTHRSFLKAYRDVLVFGVRLFMYVGLAMLMGTVWLRLGDGQNVIQAYINALFFSSAFMSFMAVAYIPGDGNDVHLLMLFIYLFIWLSHTSQVRGMCIEADCEGGGWEGGMGARERWFA